MIKDDEQLRAWCVDYALRLHPKEAAATPEQVISDARKLERYITDARQGREQEMTPHEIMRKVAEYAKSPGIEQPEIAIEPGHAPGSGTVYVTANTTKGVAWGRHPFEAHCLQERVIGRVALKAGKTAADLLHAHLSTKH